MYQALTSIFNLRVTGESRYSLLTSQGPFEIKLYERMTSASMSLTGPYEEVMSIGTRYIKEYLEGNNLKVERIEGPGCFFQRMKDSIWELGILLPSGLNVHSAPKPINKMIRITELPPGRFGTLKFKGELSPELIVRKGEELKKWLDFKGLKIRGPLRIMKLAALSLPFTRNYEVQFELY